MKGIARLCLYLGVLCLVGCGLTNRRAIDYRDEARTYELYTPPSLSKRTGKNKPLLLVLHGNPSAGWQMRLYTGMDKVARRGDFLVAYPTALTNKWPITESAAIAAETGYINGVLDDIIERYPVDTSRIYLCGISGGGIFTFHLAGRIPDRIAAIGVVAGNMPKYPAYSVSMPPVPTILFHGTEDFLFHGRPELYSVDSTLKILAAINACRDEPVINTIGDAKNDATSVRLLRYNCAVPLEFYRIRGGGHHWPGATFNADRFTGRELGNFCRDIDASQLIWDFVSKHSK